MSLSSASFGTKIPKPLFYTRTNKLQTKHVVGTTKTFFFLTNSLRSSSPQFVSLSNDNQTRQMEIQMEGGQFPLETTDNYSKELEVAVRAVHMACLLCQIVQESLVSSGNDQVQSKPDNSPVTIAGNSAIICCFDTFVFLLGWFLIVYFEIEFLWVIVNSLFELFLHLRF